MTSDLDGRLPCPNSKGKDRIFRRISLSLCLKFILFEIFENG